MQRLEENEMSKTNNTKKDSSWYAKIGAIGGRVRARKGFAVNRKLASAAGKLGGKLGKPNRRTSEHEREEAKKSLEDIVQSLKNKEA